MGMISSFLTAAPGGYTPAALARLRETVPLLALAIKSATLAQLARDVTASYIGGDAASHVLSGEIRRGMAQQIDAVILYSDLKSDERRVGKECVRTFSSRCAPYH